MTSGMGPGEFVGMDGRRGAEGSPTPRVPWVGSGDSQEQHYSATCPTEAGIKPGRRPSIPTSAQEQERWARTGETSSLPRETAHRGA